eukprot:TRINITY_DN7531_c0_g1_i1.p1 TRINITY_DN7531_c0_g1~~TRINITY_DN7531_c0_g1_i1.p1  ORF type:complete len:229 (+),score=60.34 TRINITY_DN7531_c0_g1_i1:22-687(+)
MSSVICMKCGRTLQGGPCSVCGPLKAEPAPGSAPTNPSKKKKKLGLFSTFKKVGIDLTRTSSSSQQGPPSGGVPDLNSIPLLKPTSMSHFQGIFQVPRDEQLLAEFGCKVISGSTVLVGRCFLSNRHFCFYCTYSGQPIFIIIPYVYVVEMRRLTKAAAVSADPMAPPSFVPLPDGNPAGALGIQIQTGDALVHEFFDCVPSAMYARWWDMSSKQWKASRP